MNKRQKKKYIKNEYPINPFLYCTDWNWKNCKNNCNGCSYPATKLFCKLLKREHISYYGWELSEMPTSEVFIFYNIKKNKEITLIYDKPADDYTINVYDPITHLDKPMDSIIEALHSCYQNDSYSYRYHKGTREERKKWRIQRKVAKYKESKFRTDPYEVAEWKS